MNTEKINGYVVITVDETFAVAHYGSQVVQTGTPDEVRAYCASEGKDITQDQITEARDWASDCLGMVAETVTFNRALKYITANYPGGWEAFVSEACVTAPVPAAPESVRKDSDDPTLSVGDKVFSGGVYATVTEIKTYAPGEHSASPIKNDMTAVQVITDNGSRWHGRFVTELAMVIEGAKHSESPSMREWANGQA